MTMTTTFKSSFKTSLMTICAAAAALGLAALPAQAAERQEQATAKIVKRNGVTLYCVKADMTGTLIAKEICLSEAQWNQRGVSLTRLETPQFLAANLR
jgi:predicted lipoprotein with Yx(FWY)xxD motif